RKQGRGNTNIKNRPHYHSFRGAPTPMRFLHLLTLFPFLACPHAVSAAELYVHPRGDDNHPGTRAKPLRTFDGARQAVRKLADRKEPVNVHFAEGTYYGTPVIFHAADSGTAAAPVTYQAAAGAEVVISGGSRLRLDWTPFK